MTQLDPQASRAAAAEKMAQVEDHAPEEVKSALIEAVRVVASRMAVFSSDNVWIEFERQNQSLTVPEPRVLGPLLKRAEALGFCRSTGQTTNSARRQRQSGKVTLYRSCLCGDQTQEMRPVGNPAELNAANLRIQDLELRLAEAQERIVELEDQLRVAESSR